MILGLSWQEANRWTTGPVELCMNAVRLQALLRAPPSSWLCRLWSRNEDLQWAWNRERRAVWDQVGLSHSQHNGLVRVLDASRWGHQCSKTKLTGESRFHMSTTLETEPGSLMMGSKWVDCWTSGTVCECSEIAGSPQHHHITSPNSMSHVYWSDI